MDQIRITEDNFIVNCPHGESQAWAAQFDGDVPAEAALARWQELDQVLQERPSPAAVVAAVRERLEGVAGPAELAALAWAAQATAAGRSGG